MVDVDRREAIKNIVRGAAYTAPVIFSLAIPEDGLAQGPSGMGMMMGMMGMMMMGMMMGMGMMGMNMLVAPTRGPEFAPSPGQRPPPGN